MHDSDRGAVTDCACPPYRLNSTNTSPIGRASPVPEVPVGIAEIDAVAAARPVGAAFDRDAVLGEPLFPGRQFVGGDRQRHVQRSVPVMRRDGAARHAHGLQREAALEQQQHAVAADVVGAKPLIAGERLELEHLLVEARRPVEVVDVERRSRARGRASAPPYHMLSATRASSDMRLWSHGGSNTMLTLTSPTPGTLATAFSTRPASPRRRAVRRGQRHVDRHRAVVVDVDPVDQAELVDVGRDFRVVDGLQRRDDVVGQAVELLLAAARMAARRRGRRSGARQGRSRLAGWLLRCVFGRVRLMRRTPAP